MRICHITPHLPPDQAANALLPYQLAAWARAAGHDPCFVAHPPQSSDSSTSLAEPVVWVPRQVRRHGWTASLPLSGLSRAAAIAWAVKPTVRCADLVHVHSNGLLTEVGAVLARRLAKPYVLTLYGTEIWHYRARRFGPDLFTRAYREAGAVTFYSKKLLARARELGLNRAHTSVIYPPVASEFKANTGQPSTVERAALGISASNLIVNVKRLHPLAGQRYLLEAMPVVLSRHPDTHLVICGTGPLREDLGELARTLGLGRQVTFAGQLENRVIAQYDRAADMFVLPSLLEACPTVALEALACGTPVISADNPGGVELNALFGDDVALVPRENSSAIAAAIITGLDGKRRTLAATTAIIERDFRLGRVGEQFGEVYQSVLSGSRSRR